MLSHLPKEVIDNATKRKLTPDSSLVVTDTSTILKYIDHAKEGKGAVVPVEDLGFVIDALNSPKHIYKQTYFPVVSATQKERKARTTLGG